MGDTTETPTIDSSPSFEEGAMETFDKIWPNGDKPAAEVKPEPEKPAPEIKDGKTGSDIPEEFLGGEKPTPEEDEYEKLLAEKPVGQIKHENYDKFRNASKTKIDALAKDRDALTAKIKELEERKVSPETTKRLEELEQRLNEREEQLERIAVERSPKFKERFTSKEDGLINQIKQAAKDNGLDDGFAESLLHSRGKRRFEILEEAEILGAAKSHISALLAAHDQVQGEKNDFLSQSREKLTAWEKEQELLNHKTLEHQREYEGKVFSSVLERVSKDYTPFMRVEGNEQWNAQVEANIELAKKAFNGEVPLENLGEILIKGIGASIQDKMLKTVVERYKKLQEDVKQLRAASPSAEPKDGKTTKDTAGISQHDRALATWDQFAPSNQG